MVRVENAEGGREPEDVEDECAVSREAPKCDLEPAKVFKGRVIAGAGACREVSPARSARVLRFNPLSGGAIAIERALVAAADNSKSFLGERIFVGGRRPEGNCKVHDQCLGSTPITKSPYSIFIVLFHVEQNMM